jgi:hypothetical protein
MKTYPAFSMLLSLVVAAAGAAQEPACRTGGAALADAYILANPMYALFLNLDLKPYIAANRDHFVANGDAVRCAAALSRAFLTASIQFYDPSDMDRQHEVNLRMQELGFGSRTEATPASQLYGAALQLGRLARVLPSAADGDYGPYDTPTNDIEQMQMIAGSVLRGFLAEDGDMRNLLRPLILEAANLEHQALLRAAGQLASAR